MQPIHDVSDTEANVICCVFGGMPMVAFIIAACIVGCAKVDKNGNAIPVFESWKNDPVTDAELYNGIMQRGVRENPQMLWKYQEVMEDGVITYRENEEFEALAVKKSADKFVTEQLQRAVDAGEDMPDVRFIRPITVRLMTPEEVEAARRGE